MAAIVAAIGSAGRVGVADELRAAKSKLHRVIVERQTKISEAESAGKDVRTLIEELSDKVLLARYKALQSPRTVSALRGVLSAKLDRMIAVLDARNAGRDVRTKIEKLEVDRRLTEAAAIDPRTRAAEKALRTVVLGRKKALARDAKAGRDLRTELEKAVDKFHAMLWTAALDAKLARFYLAAAAALNKSKIKGSMRVVESTYTCENVLWSDKYVVVLRGGHRRSASETVMVARLHQRLTESGIAGHWRLCRLALPESTASRSTASKLVVYRYRPKRSLPIPSNRIKVTGIRGGGSRVDCLTGGSLATVGMTPVPDSLGSKEIHVVVNPAVGSTNLAGLRFRKSCVVNIWKDGIVEVDIEGVEATNSAGVRYFSRKVRFAGRIAILMVTTRASTPAAASTARPKVTLSPELAKVKAAANAGDPKASHFLRSKAGADAGDLAAMKDLASHYRDGYGVTKNYTEAARWYLKVAEADGDHTAMFNIGLMYLQGRGVPKSREKALMWFRRAAAKGNKNSQRFLQKM